MRTLLAALVLLASSVALQAAELLMFEEPGCVWCQRWHAEIGPGYPNTDEGRQAPLRRHDLRSGVPADIRFDKPVTLTPTFVLVDNGVEVGRILGYPGASFFYPMLEALLQRLVRVPVQREVRAFPLAPLESVAR